MLLTVPLYLLFIHTTGMAHFRMLNDVDLFRAEETYSVLTGFQCILTQHSACVRQSASPPFQRYLSRRVYIKYKISYPEAWNSVFRSNTNRTDNGRDVFFVSFQNWSYEISFRIPPKWLWNSACSGGSSSAAKFRRARFSCHCAKWSWGSTTGDGSKFN